jgi:putative thioredoxin
MKGPLASGTAGRARLAWRLAGRRVSWLVTACIGNIYRKHDKLRTPAMDYIIGQKPGQGGTGPGRRDAARPRASTPAPAPAAAPAPARAPDAMIMDSDQAGFMRDVVEASRALPVLVDFWASWCGPCKTLTPTLEKVVRSAGGRVRLVKIDVDKNKALVQQLSQLGLPLQSIPTVAAFWQGQIADLFQGALPESEVKRFVEALLKLAGGSMPAADLLAEAKAAMDAGQPGEAAELYGAMLQQEPESGDAWGGVIRALLALGDAEQAQEALDQVPDKLRDHAEVAGARSALRLAEEGRRAKAQLNSFLVSLAANPHDHQARYDLATALNATGQRAEAAEALLEIMRAAPKWNDDAARLQLLRFFEAWGFDDATTVAARRKLSALLFR